MLGNYKRIHFIGIGGSGMSAIAKILLEMGYEVSGSDIKYSEILNKLQNQGAKVFIGHNSENVIGAELVVVSSAIPTNNPEYIEAIKQNIPILHRADILSILMNHKKGIAISGAHGKTTTTSMISLMLDKNGYQPTVLIGGELNDIGGNAVLGSGEYLVAEADESDGSFLKLNPFIAVVTNIENDHLDYYKNMDNMKKAFVKFIENIKDDGFAFLCIDNENVRDIIPNIKKKIFTYGIKYNADYMPKDIVLKGISSIFAVYYKEKFLGDIELNVPGIHNVYNATAAVGIGHQLGIDIKDIASALKNFRGVQRRFQNIGEVNGVKIFDDYAHHPTEIKVVLKTARLLNPRKIYAIFQPHRYTRTKLLAEEFGTAFFDADEVIVTKLYSAGEEPIPNVSSELIVSALNKNNVNVKYIEKKEEVVDYLLYKLVPGDLVITIGAGDINKVSHELYKAMKMTIRDVS